MLVMKKKINVKLGRRRFYSVLFLLLCMGMPSLQAQTPDLEYPVPIDEENFPDQSFREIIIQRYDSDENEELSIEECEKITSLYLSNDDQTVYSIEGIRYFFALESLWISDHMLTEINLQRLSQLNSIQIENVPLQSAVIKNLPELKKIIIEETQINELDVCDLPLLNWLELENNDMNCVTVSRCSSLTHIRFYDNELTSLNVRENPLLEDLDIFNNELVSLSVKENPSLKELRCSTSGITEFTIDTCLSIKELDCGDNKLTSLDLSCFPNLSTLNCRDNKLDFLDLEDTRELTSLSCGGNQLSSLDLSNCRNLESLNIGYYDEDLDLFNNGNKITHLNLDGCTRLKTLRCANNLLTSLDVSNLKSLSFLSCENNQLQSINFGTSMNALQVVRCRGNLLLLLDLHNSIALQELDCSDNKLTSLDLTNNRNLASLDCSDNCLDVPLTENRTFCLDSLLDFDITKASDWQGGSLNNNVLTFDQEDVTYRYETGYTGSANLAEVRFHLRQKPSAPEPDPEPDPEPEPTSEITLDEAHFPDDIFREYLSNHADLSQNGSLSEQEIAVLTVLDVSGMGIRWLKGIEYLTAIKSLDCSGNELVSLDLSKNTKLQTLNVAGNRRDVVIDDRNQFNVSTLFDGFSRHKATDFEGGTLDMTTLTFVQQEVTYSYATNYVGSSDDASLKFVRFSLMADRDPSVANEVSGLQTQGRVYVKNHVIHVEGIETEISVYSASGSLIYRGFDQEIPVRHGGLYLVRTGSQTWKVLVM